MGKQLTGRELLFLLLLFATAVYPHNYLKAFDMIIFLLFFFDWKAIFKVMILGHDPNTVKENPKK